MPSLRAASKPSVTSDHVVLAIDQDRRAPAKLADAGRDLCHLGIAECCLALRAYGINAIKRAVFDVDGVHQSDRK